MFFVAKDGEALYNQQKQDLEMTATQIMSSLMQNSGTTKPFRYDLNQIPYDYTVWVTNRFKVLDLTEYLKNHGWWFVTLYRKQRSRPSPRKEMQKNKMAV